MSWSFSNPQENKRSVHSRLNRVNKQLQQSGSFDWPQQKQKQWLLLAKRHKFLLPVNNFHKSRRSLQTCIYIETTLAVRETGTLFFSLSLSRSPGADRSSFILLTSINKKENEIVCVCRNASAGFSPDIILVNDRDFLKMGVITGQERNQIGRQRHTHTDQHSSATHKFLSPYGRQWHLKKEKKKKGLRPPHAPSGKAGGVRPETYGYSPLVLSTRPVPTPKWSRQLRWQFSTFFFHFFFFFYGDIWEKSRYRAAKIALPDQVLLETSDFRGIRYGSTDARLPSRLNSYQMTRVRARVVSFLEEERKKNEMPSPFHAERGGGGG